MVVVTIVKVCFLSVWQTVYLLVLVLCKCVFIVVLVLVYCKFAVIFVLAAQVCCVSQCVNVLDRQTVKCNNFYIVYSVSCSVFLVICYDNKQQSRSHYFEILKTV